MSTVIDQGKPAAQGIERSKQIESCLEYLSEEIYNITDPKLQKMALSVLGNQHFRFCYGSNSRHHNFEGGLVVHTSEVMDNAVNLMNSQSLEADGDIVRTAIMYHDIGKIFDYQVTDDKKVEYTYHKSEIHHLPKSYAIFFHDALVAELPNRLTDSIGHCILAHHGRQEWSSPVTPQTTEAFIVHCADWLSGKVSKDVYVRTKGEPVKVRRVDKVGFGTEFITTE